MTVHRDPLQTGSSRRVGQDARGIAAASSGMARESMPADLCVMCARTVPERTRLFESILRRVAILALAVLIAVWPCLRESPPSISLWPPTSFSVAWSVVSNAIYVVDSAVTLCCEPGVLAFATLQDAERFRCGFGGENLSLTQTQAYLRTAKWRNARPLMAGALSICPSEPVRLLSRSPSAGCAPAGVCARSRLQLAMRF